jgi:hypothetical protein
MSTAGASFSWWAVVGVWLQVALEATRDGG